MSLLTELAARQAEIAAGAFVSVVGEDWQPTMTYAEAIARSQARYSNCDDEPTITTALVESAREAEVEADRKIEQRRIAPKQKGLFA